jgi:hypothetical protein
MNDGSAVPAAQEQAGGPVSPSGCGSQPGLQVLGVGFGRTGTLSLRAGLEQLGVSPCLHGGSDLQGRRAELRAWIAAADSPQVTDWDALLGGYRGTVDWPAAAFWRELHEHYPAAKVILSVRDEDAWYASISKTILALPLSMSAKRRAWLRKLLIATSSWLPPSPALVQRIVIDRVFSGGIDRDQAVETFRRHTDEVKASIPAEQLLVWQPADGWEPLCKLFGVAVPSTPFPRLNDAQSVHEAARFWPLVMLREIAKSMGEAVVTAGRKIRRR